MLGAASQCKNLVTLMEMKPKRRCDFGGAAHEEGDVSLESQVVPKKDTFRYLGSMLQRGGSSGDKLLAFSVTRGYH